MSLDLTMVDGLARKAVRQFWKSRTTAAKNSKGDTGARGSVTAGKNMDGFPELLEAVAIANGLADAKFLHDASPTVIPGFFRATKKWDLLILRRNILVAAVEFKSQVGPSFGNNANNRAEEALGSATDFWTACREGAFRPATRPFLGYLFLLEDCEKSRTAVRAPSPHFPVFPEFKDASYATRYRLLMEKMMREKLYTSSALLMTKRNSKGDFTEMSPETNLRQFLAAFAGHVAAVAQS